MKDCLFWRFIGVGVVVGLVSIGYGLCKNSPLPSPSFSSSAYADDLSSAACADDFPFQKLISEHLASADDRYMRKYLPPLPGKRKEKTDASISMPPLTKGHWETPAPAAADGLFGSVVMHTVAAPAETKEPASKPADDSPPACGIVLTPAPKSFKVIIENDEGKKATIAGVQKIGVDGQTLTFTDFSGKSTISATRLSYDTSGKIGIAADRLSFFPAALNRALSGNSEKATPATPPPPATPPAETKEPAPKPADGSLSESPKKPKTIMILRTKKENNVIEESFCDSLDENTAAEVKNVLRGKSVKIYSCVDVGPYAPPAPKPYSSSGDPSSATPSAETKEPASKPADDSPSEFSKKPKTAKIILETKEGGKVDVTVCELLDENAITELIKILYRNPSSRFGPPKNPSVAASNNLPSSAADLPPATSVALLAETKELAPKPADDAPSESPKKPKNDDSSSESPKKPRAAKLVLETKNGQIVEVTVCNSLDENTVTEVKKILSDKPLQRLTYVVPSPNAPPLPVQPPTPSYTYNTISSNNPPPPAPFAYTTASWTPAPVPPAPPQYLYTAPPSNLPKLEFQKLNSEVFFGRAKVPGGWLISTPTSVTFYADPEYKWNGGSIE